MVCVGVGGWWMRKVLCVCGWCVVCVGIGGWWMRKVLCVCRWVVWV